MNADIISDNVVYVILDYGVSGYNSEFVFKVFDTQEKALDYCYDNKGYSWYEIKVE